jgi:SAM-dependent methyltransferase
VASAVNAPGNYAENQARFTGFADLYDRHRASPPTVLAEILAQFSGATRPALVVDLGSGTGLSTRYWAIRAAKVIGVEPTTDMRLEAEASTKVPTVSYLEGFSDATGLPARCANIVCCMQSLHWMEPVATFAEAARILKPGGVFAACDYDWPPTTPSWEADAAFRSCMRTARRFEKELGLTTGLRQWTKDGHLQRMEDSGRFRYTQEVLVHHQDEGNADRMVGLLLSQGYVQSVLKSGADEGALGIDTLRNTAQRALGNASRPFYWSARIRVGVV